MTLSRDLDNGASAIASTGPTAVCAFATLQTIQHRADFLKAASARRQSAGSFMLQARCRTDDLARDAGSAPRVGFTASKKIGNAVARNRAKRRLRAAAHEVLRPVAQPGWDYVLVARPQATIGRPFADLVADLRKALVLLHSS